MINKVKYVYGSFAQAKKLNCINQFLFWLQLKSICSEQGYIYKGNFIKKISEELNYSVGSVSGQIKKCCEDGFVVDEGNRYLIKGYKTIYRKLGFRFKKDYIRRFKYEGIDISSFKSKNDLKSLLLSFEIMRNGYKQKYCEIRKVVCKIKYRLKKESEKNKEALLKLKQYCCLIFPKIDFKSYDDVTFYNVMNNLMNRLFLGGTEILNKIQVSYQRASEFIRYRSKTTVANIIKKVKQNQLLEIISGQRAKVVVDDVVTYRFPCNKYNLLLLSSYVQKKHLML